MHKYAFIDIPRVVFLATVEEDAETGLITSLNR